MLTTLFDFCLGLSGICHVCCCFDVCGWHGRNRWFDVFEVFAIFDVSGIFDVFAIFDVFVVFDVIFFAFSDVFGVFFLLINLLLLILYACHAVAWFHPECNTFTNIISHFCC